MLSASGLPSLAFDNGYKKSVRAVLLLVPLVEAFALPGIVERANLQKPHAEYVHILRQQMLTHPAAGGIYISTGHLQFATFLTEIESCEVSESQERAPSKRFSKCLCRAKSSAITADPPALPLTGLPQCGLQLQKYK